MIETQINEYAVDISYNMWGFFELVYYCLKVRPKNVYALVHDQAFLIRTIAVALP